MQDFRRLLVWKRAHSLGPWVYALTRRFPREELFGLTGQMRRGAVSVAANIAEGCGRGGDKEFGRYLAIARGSASELEYYFLLAYDLRLLTRAEAERGVSRSAEVKRMLTGLVQSLDD
jgi:four helix bundle protein